MIPSIEQIAQSERIGMDQAKVISWHMDKVLTVFENMAYYEDPDVLASALYPDPEKGVKSRCYIRRAVKILRRGVPA